MKPTIAVDCDGTLAHFEFPKFGLPRLAVISMLEKLRSDGWEIIIHSSRVNLHWGEEGLARAREMVDWLLEHKIPFTRVWGLMPPAEDAGTLWERDLRDVGKPVAHCYLDDRGLSDLRVYGSDDLVTWAKSRYRNTECQWRECGNDV